MHSGSLQHLVWLGLQWNSMSVLPPMRKWLKQLFHLPQETSRLETDAPESICLLDLEVSKLCKFLNVLYNFKFFDSYYLLLTCFYKTRYFYLGWYTLATYNCKRSLILITVHISLNSYHCQCASSSIPKSKDPGGMLFVLFFREKQRKAFSVWKCLTKPLSSFCYSSLDWV